jgi:hypothetical protein
MGFFFLFFDGLLLAVNVKDASSAPVRALKALYIVHL